MARSSSLRSARDFRRVYRSGSRARVDGVTVWAAPGRPEISRLGMSIRASTGTAVQRNKLRRRMRSIFHALDPAPGHDVIVQASPEAVGRNFQELTSIVGLALQRAGVETGR